jgi:hypothetical protein
MTMLFSTRCIFRWTEYEEQPYEERITLWQANSLDEAIVLGEKEAVRYAEELGFQYIGYCQAYRISQEDAPDSTEVFSLLRETELTLEEDEEVPNGLEVFSLLRDSDLPPEEYVNRFFDTGKEYEGEITE